MHRIQGKLSFSASKDEVVFVPERPEHASRFPWHRLGEPALLRSFIYQMEPQRKDSARGVMEYVVDIDEQVLEQWFAIHDLPRPQEKSTAD